MCFPSEILKNVHSKMKLYFYMFFLILKKYIYTTCTKEIATLEYVSIYVCSW